MTHQDNNSPIYDAPPPGPGCMGLVIGALLGLILYSLCSCSTAKNIRAADIIRDTCFIERWQRDSVYVQDSTSCHVYTLNDTVHDVQRVYKTVNKIQIKHDSIYINKTDTIYRTVTQAAPKRTMKDIMMDAIDLFFMLIAGMAVILTIMWYKGK